MDFPLFFIYKFSVKRVTPAAGFLLVFAHVKHPKIPSGSRGGMHSQASYWFSIGFKQMVCTVATCYWFLALLWFTKPEAFFPLNITTGSLIAQSFFHLY
jgi:hypothetical protein